MSKQGFCLAVYIREPELAYADIKHMYISPHKQEERLRTHESKPCMQARILVHMNQRREVFFDIFKHISTKIHPKYIPTSPKVSGFHLNPSYNKTQAFTSPKID